MERMSEEPRIVLDGVALPQDRSANLLRGMRLLAEAMEILADDADLEMMTERRHELMYPAFKREKSAWIVRKELDAVPPEWRENTEVVYAIQQDRCGRGPIKFGKTGNLAERVKYLQGANPYPLRVLTVVLGADAVETVIHERLARWRLHGEWFIRCEDTLAVVEEMKTGAVKPLVLDPLAGPDMDRAAAATEAAWRESVVGKALAARGFFDG
jgi:hypothetical protein